MSVRAGLQHPTPADEGWMGWPMLLRGRERLHRQHHSVEEMWRSYRDKSRCATQPPRFCSILERVRSSRESAADLIIASRDMESRSDCTCSLRFSSQTVIRLPATVADNRVSNQTWQIVLMSFALLEVAAGGLLELTDGDRYELGHNNPVKNGFSEPVMNTDPSRSSQLICGGPPGT